MKFPKVSGTTMGNLVIMVIDNGKIKTTSLGGKQDKSWQGNDKKPWQNKDQKSWQHNKDQKPWQNNKESKPKDNCITITKDVKYFCPPGYDEVIFQAVTTLLHDKIEQAKEAGPDNTKSIIAIERDNFINFLNILQKLFDAAMTQVSREAPPENLGNAQRWTTNRL